MYSRNKSGLNVLLKRDPVYCINWSFAHFWSHIKFLISPIVVCCKFKCNLHLNLNISFRYSEQGKLILKPKPASFIVYFFGLIKQTSLQILQQINVKKCPSSIQCRDSNTWPLENESPPITTRPGLPSLKPNVTCSIQMSHLIQFIIIRIS